MLEAGAMPMVALTGLKSLTLAAGGHHFQRTNTTVLVLGGRSLDLLNAALFLFFLTGFLQTKRDLIIGITSKDAMFATLCRVRPWYCLDFVNLKASWSACAVCQCH